MIYVPESRIVLVGKAPCGPLGSRAGVVAGDAPELSAGVVVDAVPVRKSSVVRDEARRLAGHRLSWGNP